MSTSSSPNGRYWDPTSALYAQLPSADRSLLENIAPPDPADEAYVAQLDPLILTNAKHYVEHHYDLGAESTDLPRTRVTAARKTGQYLFLDVQRFGILDGNIHLLYSLKEQRIFGSFCWYVQG